MSTELPTFWGEELQAGQALGLSAVKVPSKPQKNKVMSNIVWFEMVYEFPYNLLVGHPLSAKWDIVVPTVKRTTNNSSVRSSQLVAWLLPAFSLAHS